MEKEHFVVELEELVEPSDDDNERAAQEASVTVEAFETISSPHAA